MLRILPGIVLTKLNMNFTKELNKKEGWAVTVERHQNSGFHQNAKDI